MFTNQRIGILLTVGLAFILGSAWLWAAAQGPQAIGPSEAMHKWEYKTVSASTKPQEVLDQYAGEGWELVTAYGVGQYNSTYFVFKRPKK